MQSQSLWLRTAKVFPFSAIVGHDKAKLALIVGVLDPQIGGVLLTGPKGAGKSLLVNSIERVLPEIDVVDGCRYSCSPKDPANMCQECRSRLQKGEKLTPKKKKMRIVRLPAGATEDRVLGGVDLEKAVALGSVVLQPGLLAEANRNILYVDQINLLSEHLVDSLLDAAASGWTQVEREGLSTTHPSRFMLIGSMNPEEGELRPQITDRFSLQVPVISEENPDLRTDILVRNMDFDLEPSSVIESYGQEDERLTQALIEAKDRLPSVKVPEEVRKAVARTCGELRVDGHRPDIVTLRTARAIAAYEDRLEVSPQDIMVAAELSLVHRTRSLGALAPPSMEEIQSSLQRAFGKEGIPRPPVPSKPPGVQHEVRTGLRVPRMGPRAMRKLSRREALMKLILAIALPLLHFVLAATLVTLVLLSIQGFLGVPFSQTIETFWVHYWVAVIGVFLFLMAFLYRQRETLYVADVHAQQLSRLLVDKQIIADEASLGMTFDFLEGTPPTFTMVPIEVEVQVPKIVAFLEKGSKTLSSLFKPSRESFTKREFVPVLEKRVRPLRRYVVGKHSKTETSSQVGRYVSYEMPRRRYKDIAFGPTIRAAAIRSQPLKGRLRVRITPSDLRIKIREHKVPLSILLVLDMSESMISSLDNVSKAILSLHRTASRKRDRVGLVVFKGSEAILLQHPTRNLRQVVKRLLDLGASDFTPLAAGMMKALQVLRVETTRSRDCIPLIVMITDGIVNVPLSQPLGTSTRKDFTNSAQADVVDVARLIAREGIRTLIINTDHREEYHPPEDVPRRLKWLTPTELLMEVARITRGRYYGLTLEGGVPSFHPKSEEAAVTLVKPMIKHLTRRSTDLR